MTSGSVPDELIGLAVSGVSRAEITGVLRLLLTTPSPAGSEARLAETLRDWGAATDGDSSWTLQTLTETSANLLARSKHGDGRAAELVMYSHLDTTLSGDPVLDAPVTGRTAPVPPPRFEEESDEVVGLGLSVAKGPTAAGIIGFLSAARTLRRARIDHQLTLLLAAGGTHRAPSPGDTVFADNPITRGMGIGVATALRDGLHPSAVVNVKSGASGVLHEEPGSLYLRARLSGAWTTGMYRVPDGGLLVRLADALTEIEEWRSSYLEQRRAWTGQSAGEVAVGAVNAGMTYKPDLIPATADVHVYVVTIPGDEPDPIASNLESRLRERLAGHGSSVDSVEVIAYGYEPAGLTDPEAPIVRLARDVWESRFGDGSAEVSGWTGSTDGVLFRNAGIDTVRLGVPIPPEPDDDRLERVQIGDLIVAAQMYAEIAVRYALMTNTTMGETGEIR